MAVSSRSDGIGLSRLTPPIASANRSGRASTNLRAVTDGSVIRVGYAGRNGHAYRSVGQELARRGLMDQHQVSAQAIAEENDSSSDDIQQSMAAKAKCKGNKGCPGLTSTRDQNQEIKYYDPEKDSIDNRKNKKNDK